MPPITEHGFIMQLFDFSFGYTANGITETADFDVYPGLVSIQTGLSRVSAVSAAIGLAQFWVVGGRQPVRFNRYEQFPPWVMRPLAHYTIGGHVKGGWMKGWWTLNAWS